MSLISYNFTFILFKISLKAHLNFMVFLHVHFPVGDYTSHKKTTRENPSLTQRLAIYTMSFSHISVAMVVMTTIYHLDYNAH